MRAYWSTTRPNGKPLEPGTFCRVLDMEDGTNEIYVYGKTEQEVHDKIAMNNMHAQRALARREEAAHTSATSASTTPAPIVPRKRMTADETFQATNDLQNPSKSADAVTRLVQDATGIDLRQIAMDAFKARAEEWTREHSDFYNCKPNQKLLALELGKMVNGDVAQITKQMMTETFHRMRAAGDLFEDPNESVAPSNVTPFPDETQVQRVETTRSGRSGTGTRSTNFRAPQSVQTKTLKYTREQVDRMSAAKIRSLIESNDKDWDEACKFYYPLEQAMA
jgi:hypothetical protein